MSSVRAHVVIPKDLLGDIDRLVGKRGRSQFLTGAARQEVKRLQLLKALRESAGCWKDEDHPELKHGAAAWVERMRREDEKRFAAIRRKR